MPLRGGDAAMTAPRAPFFDTAKQRNLVSDTLFPRGIEGMNSLPWVVHAEHLNSFPARSVRSHVRFTATGGVGMSKFQLGALRDFYDILREFDAVLEYNPQVRPLPGFCFDGGFRLLTRSIADRDLLIRMNEYTIPRALDSKLWAIPGRMPAFMR
ncbi:hypothetical protein ACQGAO_32165 [Rhodococcus sp. 1.20]